MTIDLLEPTLLPDAANALPRLTPGSRASLQRLIRRLA